MIDEIQVLLDQYWDWLRDKTTLRQIDDWVEITTPYLDRHNDTLQIYAKRQNGEYVLTDDGYILEDLEQSGCEIKGNRRTSLLKMTLNGFGVREVNNELQVYASEDNFAVRKHNLLQAMLAVNDLFYLAQPLVANLFYEDVVDWLDENKIRYTPNVKFTGVSGYDHLFNFVIPRSDTHPERILRTINRPNRDRAQAMAFSWIDTKDVRPPESRAYAILNDSISIVPTNVLDALSNYGVHTVQWSGRDMSLQELVA
jgi:hypothetical protein